MIGNEFRRKKKERKKRKTGVGKRHEILGKKLKNENNKERKKERNRMEKE